jgi:Flp pilus assembly pilin Flp
MRAFFLRFAKDEGGSHTTEMALAIALFALIAGFGFFAFGDALADS